MREMKDSGVEWIGEAPSDWDIVPLKANISIGHGSDPALPGDTPVWGSGGEPFKTCGEYKEGPTVLLGRKGTLDCPQLVAGRYWNVDTAFDAKIKDEQLLLKFFYYAAACIDIKPYMTNTAKPSMTQSDWSNSRIPRPALSEQRRIVSYLDERCAAIDEDVDKRREVIERLKEYKRAYISCVISKQSDRLRKTPHQSKLTLKHIASRIWDGPFGSHLKSADYIDRGVRVIRLENLRYMQFNDEKTSYVSQSKYESIKRHTVRPGDLIISTFISDEVKVAMLPDGVAFAVNKADCIGITPCKGIYSRYLQYALSTHDVFNQLKSMVHGSTRDRVNCNQIRAIKLPVPSEKAQVEIVKELDSCCSAIDEAIVCQEQLIGKLVEYRKSLIHHAVTGKIDCMEA